jgi:hypothetical protein
MAAARSVSSCWAQANQAVGFTQQLFYTACGAVTLFSAVTQTIAVQRHHAGFRTGEIGGNNHHDDQRYDQRGSGYVFQGELLGC